MKRPEKLPSLISQKPGQEGKQLKIGQSHVKGQRLLWSEFQLLTTLGCSKIEFPQPASWEKNHHKNENIGRALHAFASE